MTRRRGQSGFTLVEMLLAITILGIIIGPITESIILVIRNTVTTSNRLNTSHDAQLIDAYFESDVGNSAVATTANNGVDTYFPAVTRAGLPSQCTVTTSGVVTAIVTLHWRDSDATSPTGQSDKYAWYYLSRPAAGVAPGTLHRATCAVSVAASPALVGAPVDAVVAHDIGTSTPTVSCDTSTCPTTAFGAGSAPTPPAAVTLTVGLVSGTSSLTVNVRGVRRVT